MVRDCPQNPGPHIDQKIIQISELFKFRVVLQIEGVIKKESQGIEKKGDKKVVFPLSSLEEKACKQEEKQEEKGQECPGNVQELGLQNDQDFQERQKNTK